MRKIANHTTQVPVARTVGEITEILGVVAMFAFLNRWNDTMGTPLEAPAMEVADKAIGARGWTAGKHADC